MIKVIGEKEMKDEMDEIIVGRMRMEALASEYEELLLARSSMTRCL